MPPGRVQICRWRPQTWRSTAARPYNHPAILPPPPVNRQPTHHRDRKPCAKVRRLGYVHARRHCPSSLFMGPGDAPVLPLSCLRGHGDTPVPPSDPLILSPYCSPVPPRIPSTPTILTPILPCVPLYPQYTVLSAAMYPPRHPSHNLPYCHAFPSTPTIRFTVPPRGPHHPSSLRRSRGLQAALLSPCAGPGGRLPTRIDPPSGSRAGPTPLRPYQAPSACCSPSSSLQRWRRCSSFSLPRRHRSNPRNHPRYCRNHAAGRDPGAMGIPYGGLGFITVVRTTHDTSL